MDVAVGSSTAEIQLSSNDPVKPSVFIPVGLNVLGAPVLGVTGETVQLESVVPYSSSGALTFHALTLVEPPAAGGTLVIRADGDYGSSSEIASVAVEGLSLGTVGGVGSDCLPVVITHVY